MQTNAEPILVPFRTKFRFEQYLKCKPMLPSSFRIIFRFEQYLKCKTMQTHHLFPSEQNLDLNNI